MERTFIKPNSHAQVQGRRSVEVVRTICARIGITKDRWLELMFETGCRFVHHREPHYPAAVATLTNPDEGFWAFWLATWMKDDAEILEMNLGCTSLSSYMNLKRHYLETPQPNLLAV